MSYWLLVKRNCRKRKQDQEIVHAIQGQRQALAEEPYEYNLDDVLSTPMSVVQEHTSKATSDTGMSVCIATSGERKLVHNAFYYSDLCPRPALAQLY